MEPKGLENIIRLIRKNLYEQPTNSVAGGQIAGTVEAGDDPPVRRRRRKYIYQKGLRKIWQPQNGGSN